MVRVIVWIILPLALPTALYLVWMFASRRAALVGPEAWWTTVPWLWLFAAGAALTAIFLVAVALGFGERQRGIWQPPHLEDGVVVPGKIVPAPSR